MPGLGVGLREDDVEVRDARVRDEALAAVEDVLVAVAPRLGAHRRRVRARARLGQRVGGEPLAAREPRQEALLLLLGAGELDPERAELLDGEDQARSSRRPWRAPRSRRAPSARRCRCRRTPRRTAGRRARARGRARPCPSGNSRRLVDLGRARGDALAGERADEVADLALLVGQRVVGHREILRSPENREHAVDRGEHLEGTLAGLGVFEAPCSALPQDAAAR